MRHSSYKNIRLYTIVAITAIFVLFANAAMAGDGTISGQVTDGATGQPVAGEPVELLRYVMSEGYQVMGTTTTDASGNYNFQGLDVGGYQNLGGLVFSHNYRVALPQRFYTSETLLFYYGGAYSNDVPSAGLITHDIPIVSGTISGRVYSTYPGGAEPLAGATVELKSQDGTQNYTAITDANGNYVFKNVIRYTQTGGGCRGVQTTWMIYNVHVSAAGHHDYVSADLPFSETIFSIEHDAKVRFIWTGLGKISGQVSYVSNGEPAAGVYVIARPNIYQDGTRDYIVLTDAAGNYALENVIRYIESSAGCSGVYRTWIRYTVTVSKEGGPDYVSGELPFSAKVFDITQDVALQFKGYWKRGDITGRVKSSETGVLLAGATVALWEDNMWDGWIEKQTATTDANGDYEFSDVPRWYTISPGGIRYYPPYQIRVSAEGYKDYISEELKFVDPVIHIVHNVLLDPLRYFIDVTDLVGLSSYGSKAAAFFDYDKDGDLDLYLAIKGLGTASGGGRKYPNILLQNVGDYIWEDVSGISGLDSMEYSVDCLVNDFDNDGDDDVYLLNSVWWTYGGPVPTPCQLFKNKGNGTFADISAAAGVDVNRAIKGALTIDYDNDGNLDILIVGHINTEGAYGKFGLMLFRNNGDGTFTDLAEEAGLKRFDAGGLIVGDNRQNPVFADFNNDGFQDIYIPNASSKLQSEYYLNNGDGTFIESAGPAGIDAGAIITASAGDYNNDGSIDIFVTGNFDQPGGVNHLYRNNGDGTFIDMAALYGLQNMVFGYDVTLVDIDNDGYLDIFGQSKATSMPASDPYILYKNVNVPGGGFINESAYLGIVPKGRTAALLDYDDDGYLDVYTGEVVYNYYGDILSSEGALHANTQYDNNNNWIKVELIGTQSNRDGIGARVTVAAGSLVQTRDMTGTKMSGFNNFTSNIFGLGNEPAVDYIEVKWPSGVTQTISGYDIIGNNVLVKER